MKTKFYKTEHFRYRQWDRGIDDGVIDKIACVLKEIPNKKSLLIVSNELLKKIGAKIKKKTNLIIVSKGKALITLFYVDDLYKYLKSQKGKLNTILL